MLNIVDFSGFNFFTNPQETWHEMKIFGSNLGTGAKCGITAAILILAVLAWFYPDVFTNSYRNPIVWTIAFLGGIFSVAVIAEVIGRKFPEFEARFSNISFIGVMSILGISFLGLLGLINWQAYEISINVARGLVIDDANTMIPAGWIGVSAFYAVILIGAFCFVKHVIGLGREELKSLKGVAEIALSMWLTASIAVSIVGGSVVVTYTLANPEVERARLVLILKDRERAVTAAQEKRKSLDASR
jgi:hypothetical protein